jgi:hypothetical protein
MTTTSFGNLPCRSRAYGVFVFWRGFFKDSTQVQVPMINGHGASGP